MAANGPTGVASNQSITPDDRTIVEELNRFATRPEVLAALRRALADAVRSLQRTPDLPATFLTVDPASLGGAAPAAIGSIRVAVTRDGAGVERHPNSRQYLFALDGPMETHVHSKQGWRVDRFGDGEPTVLEHRWHVVPAGVWHRSLAPGRHNWGVVAFHTAKDVRDEYQ
jgi:hypothetical protein